MKKLVVAVIFCFIQFNAHAQDTEIFAAVQTGNPFSSENSDGVYLNYSFGIEQYFIKKLSLAISYRKTFNLSDNEYNLNEFYYNGYFYTYKEENSSFAIDLESKYFFDSSEEGWYMSSGISYQSLKMTMDVTIADYYSGVAPAPPVPAGTYTESHSIFPLSLKAGHRNSGDVIVFDYYFGVAFNLGSGDVKHTYQDYLQYDSFNSVSFILGLKMGFKL